MEKIMEKSMKEIDIKICQKKKTKTEGVPEKLS